MENTVQIVKLLLGVLFFVLPILLTKLNKTLILDDDNHTEEEEADVQFDFNKEEIPTNKPIKDSSTTTGDSISDYIKSLEKNDTVANKNGKQEESKDNSILTDFDLKKAVIYSEILKPKWKE